MGPIHSEPGYLALRLSHCEPASHSIPPRDQPAGSSRSDDHEWLDALLNTTDEGAIGINTSRQVVFMNRVAEELSGWKSADAIGQSLNALIPDVTDSQAASEDSCGNAGGLVQFNGAKRLVVKRTSTLPQGDAVILLRDITEESRNAQERHRISAELAQAHEGLQQLAYSASHLLANALEYRGDLRPHIEISAQWSESEWKIAVSDNGMGIPFRYHSLVFGVFKHQDVQAPFRGRASGCRSANASWDIIMGRIWLESEEGKGSAFYFTISASCHQEKRGFE
jgi:signal transduction histidine kinase